MKLFGMPLFPRNLSIYLTNVYIVPSSILALNPRTRQSDALFCNLFLFFDHISLILVLSYYVYANLYPHRFLFSSYYFDLYL